NSSEEVVRYEPMNLNMSSLKQMTEMFVKQYVTIRNTVINDEREMRTRWGPGGIMQYMSAPPVYSEFVGQNAAKVENMFDSEYSSEVRIDKIGKIGENSPVWVVYFTVFNLSRNQETGGALLLKEARYRASVTPRYFLNRGFVSPRLINPLGFTVMKYSQDKIRE
ncbi:MAG: type IV secretion system protein, partial [Alphaproteobacteria bacterium]|nr:type IV secretion system protein [Alphaproteobacteria bacterium]